MSSTDPSAAAVGSSAGGARRADNSLLFAARGGSPFDGVLSVPSIAAPAPSQPQARPPLGPPLAQQPSAQGGNIYRAQPRGRSPQSVLPTVTAPFPSGVSPVAAHGGAILAPDAAADRADVASAASSSISVQGSADDMSELQPHLRRAATSAAAASPSLSAEITPSAPAAGSRRTGLAAWLPSVHANSLGLSSWLPTAWTGDQRNSPPHAQNQAAGADRGSVSYGLRAAPPQRYLEGSEFLHPVPTAEMPLNCNEDAETKTAWPSSVSSCTTMVRSEMFTSDPLSQTTEWSSNSTSFAVLGATSHQPFATAPADTYASTNSAAVVHSRGNNSANLPSASALFMSASETAVSESTAVSLGREPLKVPECSPAFTVPVFTEPAHPPMVLNSPASAFASATVHYPAEPAILARKSNASAPATIASAPHGPRSPPEASWPAVVPSHAMVAPAPAPSVVSLHTSGPPAVIVPPPSVMVPPPAAVIPPPPTTALRTVMTPASPQSTPPSVMIPGAVAPSLATPAAQVAPMVAPPAAPPEVSTFDPQMSPAANSLPPSRAVGSLRRVGHRYQYAPIPGLTAAHTAMAHASETPFATPRGSISEASALLAAPALLPPPLPPGPVRLEAAGWSHTNWLEENAFGAEGYSTSAEPTPVTALVAHWFYCKTPGSNNAEPEVWEPFSNEDSALLEAAFIAAGDVPRDAVVLDADDPSPPATSSVADPVVQVHGRRYDVHVTSRLMHPVFWRSAPARVRRATWFSRGAHEPRYAPYAETVSAQLEQCYQQSAATGRWHQEVAIGEESGTVMVHSPQCLVHHPGITSGWEHVNMPDDPSRPRQVRRGWDAVDGISPPPDESPTVNHLVFVVHGIGPWCDLKFRKVNECVDDLRRMGAELAGSHFAGALAAGRLGRVEFLPISWHDALHGTAHDLDAGLRSITLPSTPLLRQFTNDTIVDVLYYTSPVFHKVILQRVGNDINSVYGKFCSRFPEFQGGVSLAGHSLGSLILFDLLSEQDPSRQEADPPPLRRNDAFERTLQSLDLTSYRDALVAHDFGSVQLLRMVTEEDMDRMNMTLGARRKLINWQHSPVQTASKVSGSYESSGEDDEALYPQLKFKPSGFYGFGSPIGLFLRVRGYRRMETTFRLPTCPKVFNIYHPYDPVSFRIEPLIVPEMIRVRPVLVPHHKGRKRMHLEIKDQMVRIGAEIKHHFMSSLQTFSSVYDSWMSTATTTTVRAAATAGAEAAEASESEQEDIMAHGDANLIGDDIRVGRLSGGRRIDYVLQETPLETLNEYVFAFQSRLTYWESRDAVLLVMTEVLKDCGIEADAACVHHATPPPPPVTPATGPPSASVTPPPAAGPPTAAASAAGPPSASVTPPPAAGPPTAAASAAGPPSASVTPSTTPPSAAGLSTVPGATLSASAVPATAATRPAAGSSAASTAVAPAALASTALTSGQAAETPDTIASSVAVTASPETSDIQVAAEHEHDTTTSSSTVTALPRLHSDQTTMLPPHSVAPTSVASAMAAQPAEPDAVPTIAPPPTEHLASVARPPTIGSTLSTSPIATATSCSPPAMAGASTVAAPSLTVSPTAFTAARTVPSVPRSAGAAAMVTPLYDAAAPPPTIEASPGFVGGQLAMTPPVPIGGAPPTVVPEAARTPRRAIGGRPLDILPQTGAVGVDPTVSMNTDARQLPPPPTMGFRRT